MSHQPQIFSSVAEGLEAELRLLESTKDDGQSRCLIWQAKSASLTLPERYSRTEPFSSAIAAMKTRGWPVVARRTGGGITPQGPGIINVAIAFTVPPKDARSVPASYAAICDPLVTALSHLGIAAQPGPVSGSFCDGDYNLEVDGRKIVGTAQRWRGASVLCHALVLVDPDLDAAVAAAQSLAHHLHFPDIYHRNVHTSLGEHLSGDFQKRFCEAIGDQLRSRGFKAT